MAVQLVATEDFDLFEAGTGADGLSTRFHINRNGTVAAFNVPAGTTVTLDNGHFMGEQ